MKKLLYFSLINYISFYNLSAQQTIAYNDLLSENLNKELIDRKVEDPNFNKNSLIENNPFETALEDLKKDFNELNNHIITLDNGRYKGLQINNDYFISHYENGNFSKAKLEDIGYVKSNNEYSYVKLACKDNNKCVFSTITNQYHDYFNFNSTSSTIDKTEQLLNKFLISLKNYMRIEKEMKNASLSNTSAPISNADALKNLNEFIPKYNSVSYRTIKVVGDSVDFRLSIDNQIYYYRINKKDLIYNTYLVDESESILKIQCKDGKKLFWSNIYNDYKSDFPFSSNINGDKQKLAQLLTDFIKTLEE